MAISRHSLATVLSFPEGARSAALANRVTLAERRLAERRIKLRYPLDLRVRFRAFRLSSPLAGVGVAVNLSSGGILVVTKHEFDVGAPVAMSIEWPALLEGRIPLQLCASGHVVRSNKSSFAAAFDRHEFRIMGGPAI